MGFRFRRTVKILPGIRLNIGKRGLSTSFGVRGASVTVGRRGVYGNVGIPGSGLSWRSRLDNVSQKNGRSGGAERSDRLPQGVRFAGQRSPSGKYDMDISPQGDLLFVMKDGKTLVLYNF
ncbi:MAG: DUF4236 domain-containing protein [Desulfovibrionaceae bacterium]|nr:DUF4236 domain-containing protein [Desulfovibrionaceae bacterium]